ncbi:MAG: alpha/beta hydrolase [Rhodococcus sp. (in: high G+C Gram-positive bacteria)]
MDQDGNSVLWRAEDMWRRHTMLVTAGVHLDVLADRIRPLVGASGWEGSASDAARAATAAVADELGAASAMLRRIGVVAARAGDDRAALSRWDPDDESGALSDLDRSVAANLSHVGDAESRTEGVRTAGSVDALDSANRRRMATMRRELVAAETRLTRELDESPFGGLFTDADAGVSQTRARLASLDALDEVLARPGRRLVHLQAGPRRTIAAVSVGDVDRADRIAVFVPGAGTTVDNSLAAQDLKTAAIVDAAGHVGPRSLIAGITWIGYEAPQWNTELFEPQRSVAGTAPAHLGAQTLTTTLDALHSSRHMLGDAERTPAVTVVAHSYGTVVASEALGSVALGSEAMSDGAETDAVVVMGSPGWSAPPSAAPSPYVAEARWDPVADLGWFGPDPSELPNAIMMSTGAGSGHSSYLDPGSDSAHVVAQIVSGVDVPSRTRTLDVADLIRLLVSTA